MTGSLNANAVAQHLELQDGTLGGVRLSAKSQGHLIRETLKRFMQGARSKPADEDIPVIGKLQHLDPPDLEKLRNYVLDKVSVLWSRMSSPTDALPLGHDGYLKLWALSEPALAADFILLDEAQDTNPVVLGVLQKQNAQIVYVGDRHQQIYEWRGAVNAMERIDTPHTAQLTTSFRFGNVIAGAASDVLAKLGETARISGNAGKEGYLGADNCRAVLARTNASVIATVISQLDGGRLPHVVGGTAELIRMLRGVQDLKRPQPSDVSEFFGFANWNEVVEHSKTPEGEDIKTFVSLVEQHGEAKLIAMLNKTAPSEEAADVIVSTAHKAKGREWETVQLLDDFLQSKPQKEGQDTPPEVDPAEIRLFYVALTRGKTAVDVSPAVLAQFGISPGPRMPARVVPPPPPVRPAPGKNGAAPAPAKPRPTSYRAPDVQREKSSGGVLKWWWLPLAIWLAYQMLK